MSRYVLLLLLPILGVAPWGAPLAAQQFVPFAGGGLAIGTSDLAQDTDNGWLVFGGVDVPLAALPGLSAGVAASYARIPYGGGFGEATGVTTVSGQVGYQIGAAPGRPVVPYVRGGVGLHVHRYDPGDLGHAPTSDARPGVNAGAGVNVLLGAASAFLGAHFATGTDAGFLSFIGGVALPGLP